MAAAGRSLPQEVQSRKRWGLRGLHRSGLPMPVAGRSLRASGPALARCFLRFAILAARRKQCRLPGTGSPELVISWVIVCWVVISCVVVYGATVDPASRTSSGSEARAEAGDTCGRWTPTFGKGRELTSAAGAEHASDPLRQWRCTDANGSRASRASRVRSPARRCGGAGRRRRRCGPPCGDGPAR